MSVPSHVCCNVLHLPTFSALRYQLIGEDAALTCGILSLVVLPLLPQVQPPEWRSAALPLRSMLAARKWCIFSRNTV